MNRSLHPLVESTRRSFLGNVYTGLGGIGLMQLLADHAVGRESDWMPGRGQTHDEPKAKRVLQIMCPGAASHVDLWEYKQSLRKYHGEPLPGEENMVSFQGKNGNLMKSPWAFAPAGESGKMITTMLPHMAKHADDIAFLHAMHSKTNTHGPGCVFVSTGHDTEGFPSAALGSVMPWVAPTKICQLTLRSPIFAVNPLTAKPIGRTVFYPLAIKPS